MLRGETKCVSVAARYVTGILKCGTSRGLASVHANQRKCQLSPILSLFRFFKRQRGGGRPSRGRGRGGDGRAGGQMNGRRHMNTNSVGEVAPLRRLKFKRRPKPAADSAGDDKENAFTGVSTNKKATGKPFGAAVAVVPSGPSAARAPLSNLSNSAASRTNALAPPKAAAATPSAASSTPSRSFVTCESGAVASDASLEAPQAAESSRPEDPAAQIAFPSGSASLSDGELALDVSALEESLLQADDDDFFVPLTSEALDLDALNVGPDHEARTAAGATAETPYRREAKSLIRELEEECSFLREAMPSPGEAMRREAALRAAEADHAQRRIAALASEMAEWRAACTHMQHVAVGSLFVLNYHLTRPAEDPVASTSDPSLAGAGGAEVLADQLAEELMSNCAKLEQAQRTIEEQRREMAALRDDLTRAQASAEESMAELALASWKAAAQADAVAARSSPPPTAAQAAGGIPSPPRVGAQSEIVLNTSDWVDFGCQVNTFVESMGMGSEVVNPLYKGARSRDLRSAPGSQATHSHAHVHTHARWGDGRDRAAAEEQEDDSDSDSGSSSSDAASDASASEGGPGVAERIAGGMHGILLLKRENKALAENAGKQQRREEALMTQVETMAAENFALQCKYKQTLLALEKQMRDSLELEAVRKHASDLEAKLEERADAREGVTGQGQGGVRGPSACAVQRDDDGTRHADLVSHIRRLQSQMDALGTSIKADADKARAEGADSVACDSEKLRLENDKLKGSLDEMRREKASHLADLDELRRVTQNQDNVVGLAEGTIRRLKAAVSKLSSENASLCSQIVNASAVHEMAA